MDQADRWNKSYESGRDFPRFSLLLLNKLPAEARQGNGKLALDVGCGTGDLASKLHGLGYEVTGVDLSSVATAKASQLCPAGKFIAGDIMELALDKNFNLITCKLVYPFISNKDGLLGKVHDLLTDGGCFLLQTLVLEPGYDYTEREKAIATDRAELEQLLKKHFGKFEVLAESYFNDRELEVTYLCHV